jgi:hypothetical protein
MTGDAAMDTERIIDLIDWLDLEVENGGFHQFFHNSPGDHTEQTIHALEIIGALTAADIVKRAAGMFPDGMPPRDRNERMDVLWKRFPDPRAFYSLNEEFYDHWNELNAAFSKFKTSRRDEDE